MFSLRFVSSEDNFRLVKHYCSLGFDTGKSSVEMFAAPTIQGMSRVVFMIDEEETIKDVMGIEGLRMKDLYSLNISTYLRYTSEQFLNTVMFSTDLMELDISRDLSEATQQVLSSMGIQFVEGVRIT